MAIRILLVDDHMVVRQGLRSLLEKHADMEVVAEADNGRKAVQLATDLTPEVVILDVAMPDMNGVEAARRIVSASLNTKIVALSMYPQKRFVAEMFKAGAKGYLLKTCEFKELVEAIKTVVRDETYLSPSITQTVIEDYVSRLSSESGGATSILTPREREVLQLVAEGKSTKKIASKLHVSAKTIDAHRQNIMDKLNIRSIAELTKYALDEGLTFLES